MNIGGLMATLGIDSQLWKAEQDLKYFQKSAENSLTKVQQKMDKVADSMQKVGTKMTMFVTAPIIAAGGYAFKMASDLNESLNKSDVAFKTSGKVVQDWSKTTLNAFGIAQGSALDMVSMFGDMATSMGLPTSKAAEMSMSLVGLAGDLASFKNIPIAETQTALAAVFTGETESLKRLGIVITEVNLKEFALSQGITKKMEAMTQAEKVNLRYNYIMSVTKNSQGDFTRTASGAANQMRSFTEGIKETAASFGSLLLPTITSVITWVNSLLKSIMGMTETQKRWLMGALALVAALGPLALVIGTTIKIVGVLSVAVGGLTTAMAWLKVATLSNPWGMVITAVAALGGLMYTYFKNTESAAGAQIKLTSDFERFNKLKNSFNPISDQMKGIGGMNKGGLEGLQAEIQSQIALEKQASLDIEKEYNNRITTDKEYLAAKAGMEIKAVTEAEKIEVYKNEQIVFKKQKLFNGLKEVESDENKKHLTSLQTFLKQVETQLTKVGGAINVKALEATEAFNKGLVYMATNEKLFGTSLDDGKNKLDLYTTYLKAMIDSGITSGKVIDGLKSRIEGLSSATEKVKSISGFDNLLKMQSGYKPTKAKGGSFDFTPVKQDFSSMSNQWAGDSGIGYDVSKAEKMAAANVIQANTTEALTKKLGDMSNEYRKGEIAQAKLLEPTKWQTFGDAINGVALNFQSLGDAITKAMDDGKVSFVEGANIIMQAALSMIGILSALAAAHMITAESSKGLIGILTAVAGLALLAGLFATFATPKKATGMAGGGIVPQGYPNDTFPAMLSSGEQVIPAKGVKGLNAQNNIHITVAGVTRGTDIHYIVKEVERRNKNVG